MLCGNLALGNMDDDTAVIKEIPVYLSQSLSKNLVVYQFLYKHGGLNPSNANVIQCSIKENPHEIMLELERNTDSVNYCLARGEQIAINVDGRDGISKNPEEVTFPKNIMDRQTYVSKSYADLNFAVGVLHENELHLTPLETMALLRPSFKYLDKSDKRLRNEGRDNAEVDLSGDEEEPKQIVVKFARQESEKTKKARERSFSHASKMSAKETWYKSNYHNKKTDKSEIEFSKLYCKKQEDKTTEMKADALQLLAHLSADEGDASINSSHGDSLSALSKVPLVERVKKFLHNARLIQFSQLVSHLGSASEVQDYLKAVQQVAVLVQGCWVVQSDVIYSKEIFAGGVPGSLMKCARDYILYLFTKSRSVRRREIQETVKVPSHLIKEILEEVSAVTESKEWEFLLETDHDFAKAHPDVVQRQFIKWEMKHEQLVESFKSAEGNVGATTPAKHRRKSYRESSLSSDNESGNENRRKGYQIATGHKIRRTKKNSQSSSDLPANS